MKKVRYHIVSKPISIDFICPCCDEAASIPWREIHVPPYCAERGLNIVCPNCGVELQLDE